jgi:hypothetical protein
VKFLLTYTRRWYAGKVEEERDSLAGRLQTGETVLETVSKRGRFKYRLSLA